MNKFLSIIPARIGSKGIPKKNLYPFHKKPLIEWTIEASLNSKYIDKTIVSSDSNEILDLDLNFFKHKRSKKLSNDSARSVDIVLNILDEETSLNDYEYLIFLQPTSPLRTTSHIDNACAKIIKNNTDSLMTVREISNGVLKTFIHDGKDGLRAGFDKEFPFMPRQELPKAFMPNGAIYITRIKSFLENKSFMSKNNSFMVMDGNSSIDIDNLDDIRHAESVSNFKKS
jgi:CMP-N,N'-diacetyllegionaminic acid synthase